MSYLSPIDQATSERRNNQRAIGTFIFVTAIVFAAWWIGRDSLFSSANGTPDNNSPSASTGTSEPGAIRDTAMVSSSSHADWTDQIVAIKHELSRDDAAETRDVVLQLDRLQQELESRSAKFASESEQALKIDQTIADIRLRVIEFRPDSKSPGFSDGDIAARIASDAQELLRVERIENERVIAAARQAISDEHASDIRKVRLELRDQQDQVKLLQHRIASKQRELNVRREKQKRADALNADMADVRAYLSPFTTPSQHQPSTSAKIWNRTAEVKPVSLRLLKEKKALEPIPREIETFYMLGGEIHPAFNVRPLGSFPRYREGNLGNPEVMAVVKRAQQLIRDHGEALVEAGLLSE